MEIFVTWAGMILVEQWGQKPIVMASERMETEELRYCG